MLRDHQIFNSPHKVDRSRSTSIPTPSAWKREVAEQEVSVLPIVSDTEKSYHDGWCVYTYEHTQAPELEIICGGINAKTPKASAIWRQGFLMHFGFEPAPDQLNENGQALLVNSICYIAKYGNDRPLVRTPSTFYSRVRKYDRDVIGRLVENTSRELGVYLGLYLTVEAKSQVEEMDRDTLAAWFAENRGFLRANDEGKYSIDTQAKQFGLAVDTHEFVQTAILATAQDFERAEMARDLLERYLHIGPKDAADSAAWQQWYADNKDYLFFSDTGGFCWLIDPLAKRKAIPTDRLRGAARVK